MGMDPPLSVCGEGRGSRVEGRGCTLRLRKGRGGAPLRNPGGSVRPQTRVSCVSHGRAGLGGEPLCLPFSCRWSGRVGSSQARWGDTQGTRTHRHVPLFLSRLPRGQGRRHAIMPSSESPPPFLGTVSSSSSSAGSRGCGTATPARVRVSFPSRFPAPLSRSGQARGQGHVHALFSFPLSSFPPASLSLPVCSLSLSLSFSPSGEGFSSSFSRR